MIRQVKVALKTLQLDKVKVALENTLIKVALKP